VSLPVATWSWNYTTYLDVLALVGGVALVWLARQRVRLGGGQGYATDPVCHMQVRTADAPVTVALDGRTYYFCCDGCANRFTQDPMAYLTDEPPIDA